MELGIFRMCLENLVIYLLYISSVDLRYQDTLVDKRRIFFRVQVIFQVLRVWSKGLQRRRRDLSLRVGNRQSGIFIEEVFQFCLFRNNGIIIRNVCIWFCFLILLQILVLVLNFLVFLKLGRRFRFNLRILWW